MSIDESIEDLFWLAHQHNIWIRFATCLIVVEKLCVSADNRGREPLSENYPADATREEITKIVSRLVRKAIDK